MNLTDNNIAKIIFSYGNCANFAKILSIKSGMSLATIYDSKGNPEHHCYHKNGYIYDISGALPADEYLQQFRKNYAFDENVPLEEIQQFSIFYDVEMSELEQIYYDEEDDYLAESIIYEYLEREGISSEK